MNNFKYRNVILKMISAAIIFMPMRYSHAFEVGINMHVRHYPNSSDYYLKLAKEYGFTSIREDYPWAQVEGPIGKYSLIGNLGGFVE